MSTVPCRLRDRRSVRRNRFCHLCYRNLHGGTVYSLKAFPPKKYFFEVIRKFNRIVEIWFNPFFPKLEQLTISILIVGMMLHKSSDVNLEEPDLSIEAEELVVKQIFVSRRLF